MRSQWRKSTLSSGKRDIVKEQGRLQSLYQEFRAGTISRRDFLQRAVALGVAAPVALGILRLSDVAAQEATPEAAPVTAAPTSGTDGQTRGELLPRMFGPKSAEPYFIDVTHLNEAGNRLLAARIAGIAARLIHVTSPADDTAANR